MADERSCPDCGHKFAGATHSPAGKGCDVIVERGSVKERCGCKADPVEHGLSWNGGPRG